ncbi:MAG: serine/threonine protein kinase [Myxococcales bacterium]|nr:serine/threonine protein kinase [Myxococcales bacterium]
MTVTALRFGKYALTERLGEGGMGTLYLGTIEGPNGFSKPCAVKRIRPAFVSEPAYREMLAHEARVAAQLSHPNIVQVFDFGEVDGEAYLTMEYVDGASLARVLRQARDRGDHLGWTEAAVLGMALCDALDYIHSGVVIDGARTPLVHRDVSPGNVLVSTHGAIKLTDFGIVKVTRAPGLTESGVVKGKYGYMSPEQLKGQPLDGRSDVFALGAVLWEVLAGRPLFQRPDVAATIAAVIAGRVPRLTDFAPDAPAELQGVLEHALAPDRRQRFSTARALHDALATLMSTDEIAEAQRRLARRAASAGDPAAALSSGPAAATDPSLFAAMPEEEAPEDNAFVWAAVISAVVVAGGLLWLMGVV